MSMEDGRIAILLSADDERGRVVTSFSSSSNIVAAEYGRGRRAATVSHESTDLLGGGF